MESGRFFQAFLATLLVHAVAAIAVWDSYSPVKPVLECVEVARDGTVTAHFGYLGIEDQPVDLPIGEDNFFAPGEADRGQPSAFAPGRTKAFPNAAFRVTFRGPALTWSLDGQEVVATRASQACRPPDEQRERPMPKVQKIKPIEKKIEKKEEPKEEPKVEKKEEPKETKKPEAKKEPTRKPKNVVRKKGQPKKRKPPSKQPQPVTKAEPAPLVMENVSLKGTVAVQAGEQDLFGDPSVAANDRNVNVEVVDDPDKLPDKVGDGTGGGEVKKAPPKFVAPRIEVSVGGRWPADAPRLGRTVTVVLSLSVGTDGEVKKVKVVKGAGKVFDDAARKVGFKLKFKPGTRDGRPVAMPVRWTVEFRPD